MAEIAGLSLAVIGIAGKIAKNLYIFINKVENCSHVIHALLQIVLDVKRDSERVKRAAAELSRRPNASTLASELLDALDSLESPLKVFDQRLGDLHEGQPTRLGLLILTYKYEACRDELETFQRQIDNGYRSLLLALSLAQVVGQNSGATDRTQPLPPIRPLTPQSISSSELRPRSRQPSNASTVYGEPASELFRATERLKVTKVRELLDAGASIDSRDSQGRSLIDVAVTLGGKHPNQDKMVDMLLSRGAKFTCTDPAAVKLFREIKSTIKLMGQRRRRGME